MIATESRCAAARTNIPNLVSVVVPAYNAEDLILMSLSSIVAQTHSPLEIIVVDDGSTDDTRTVVQSRFPSVKLVSQPNSGGCSSPRNNGARIARGEFITFFDADDIMVPDKLQRQYEWLKRNAHAAAVIMDYQNFDERGPWECSHFDTCPQLRELLRDSQLAGERTLNQQESRRVLIEENFTIAGSPLMRTEVFTKLGGFDESLCASEDFEFIYRLASAYPVGVIDRVGFLRRMHSSNMSHRTEHILRYKIESRMKLLGNEATPENQRALRRAISRYHFSLADFLARSDGVRAGRHLWEALRFGYPLSAKIMKCVVKCIAGALRFG